MYSRAHRDSPAKFMMARKHGSRHIEHTPLRLRFRDEPSPPSPHEPTSYPSRTTLCLSDTTIQSCAGAVSGTASSFITCPLDVMKTKLQGRAGLRLWTLDTVSKRRAFRDRGLVGTGRATWHERGLVGMYQGLGPTMLANLPRGAIFFTVYHRVKGFLKERNSKSRPLDIQAKHSWAMLIPDKRPSVMGILKHLRSCWRYLLDIVHKSIVGY